MHEHNEQVLDDNNLKQKTQKQLYVDIHQGFTLTILLDTISLQRDKNCNFSSICSVKCSKLLFASILMLLQDCFSTRSFTQKVNCVKSLLTIHNLIWVINYLHKMSKKRNEIQHLHSFMLHRIFVEEWKAELFEHLLSLFKVMERVCSSFVRSLLSFDPSCHMLCRRFVNLHKYPIQLT